MPAQAYFLGLFVATLFSLEPMAAAVLTASSATVARPSDPARICVGLELDADDSIAGTENQLVWDGSCATLLPPTCSQNPRHGKSLFTGAIDSSGRLLRYKVLVVSLTDTSAITDSGELYCCDFLVHAEPGECCAIEIDRPGASDPDGNAVAIGVAARGEACMGGIASPATPTIGFATATASPTIRDATATVSPGSNPGTRTRLPNRATRTHWAQATRTRPSLGYIDDDACSVRPAADGEDWVLWALHALTIAGLSARARRRRSR